jgi:hypothetical protein
MTIDMVFRLQQVFYLSSRSVDVNPSSVSRKPKALARDARAD